MAKRLAASALLFALTTGGLPHCLTMVAGHAPSVPGAHQCCAGGACDSPAAPASWGAAPSFDDCCVLAPGPAARPPVERVAFDARLLFAPAIDAVPLVRQHLARRPHHPPIDGPPGTSGPSRHLLLSVLLI